ncbi:hypothetical protein [Microbispora sp. KK1-11]|uniref:hypothetical protein n=1 Tax=Microbispora sp. KK1-11 TaxID=2053005 RepID=UPI00163C6E87|nr:hypothetical protein [Microbispora sp. KK1-11]
MKKPPTGISADQELLSCWWQVQGSNLGRASIKLDARDRAQLVAIFFQGNNP